MRVSIAAKIFAGFTAIIIIFGGVSTYSLVRMHRLQEDLRFLNRVYLRLNEAYIQLNLFIKEVHTLQNNLINLLGSMPEERNPVMVTRWIRMARTHREKRIKQGLRIAKNAKRAQLPHPETVFFNRVVKDLETLQRQFQKTNNLYEQLFKDSKNTTDTTLPARIQVMRSGLRRRERDSFSTLRSLSNALRRRLSNNVVPKVIRAAGRLEATENQTFYATAIWAVLALILGVAITWLSQWTLRPLSRLAEGARRIGKGEYGLRMKIKSADEVGALAREFNVMASAIQEREERLIETERRAARAQRMATMGHLAAQITHEIRNPLSSISLNAEMMEEEIGENGNPDEAKILARLIQNEVDRLADITEEYLQFARMPQLKLEKDDLGASIRSIVNLVRREFQQDGVTLDYKTEENLPQVILDENQFRRALLNILKNAREAISNDGEIDITTFVKPSDSTLQVVVRIRDNGPGIPEKKLEEIFEPFFSTKEQGTGLGLAITQQILHEHGATIEVTSNKDEGTLFEICFPCA